MARAAVIKRRGWTLLCATLAAIFGMLPVYAQNDTELITEVSTGVVSERPLPSWMRVSNRGLVAHWPLNSANVEIGANLVTNPGAETALPIFGGRTLSGRDGSVELSALQKHGGSNSVLFTGNGTPGDTGMQFDHPAAANSGKWLVFSAWAYLPTGSDFTWQKLRIYQTGGSGNLTSTSISTRDTWLHHVLPYIAGTNYTTFCPGAFSTDSFTGTYYSDDIDIHVSQADDIFAAHHGGIIGASLTTGHRGEPDGALDLDGTDDYVDVGDTSLEINTVAFWVNLDDATTRDILDLDGGTHYLTVDGSSDITATGFGTPTIYVDGVVGTAVSADTWYHVAVTTETAIDANDVLIGYVSGNRLDGSISDVRGYSRALTAGEVAVLATGVMDQ